LPFFASSRDANGHCLHEETKNDDYETMAMQGRLETT